MSKVKIKVHTANALKWLGRLYRNPADAIKEHVSNAVDEHLKAQASGGAVHLCRVCLSLERDRITIDYPYGMSHKEFEDALQRVADSAKKDLDFGQIGQLGIGMFSFLQLGTKCVFHCRKRATDSTTMVVLREGSDDAEFGTPTKRDELKAPGMRVTISGLHVDPTKPRGPLSAAKLQKVLTDKFDRYLRDGSLEIAIQAEGRIYAVEPLAIDLPQVGGSYTNWPLQGDRSRMFSLELYFDPTARGKVGIRHTGVTVVDDISTLDAYGLEESVYASGDLKGHIDADFLVPLPARSGFEQNKDWIALLSELDGLAPAVEMEVQRLKQEETDRRLSEVQKKAIDLARNILNGPAFKDLELLEGFGRKSPTSRLPPNGFDFVPSSIRLDVGGRGSLPLKAAVPAVVPDQTAVRFSVTDPSAVALETKAIVLRAADADENGIVTASIGMAGLCQTALPVQLQATTLDDHQTAANVRVGLPIPRAAHEPEGPRITYEETPFEDGPSRHSRYVARMIQINELNRDYVQEVKEGKLEEAKIAYAALMIGKETVAFNDKSGSADEYLEKLLSFYFEVKNALLGRSASIARRPRGRPKKTSQSVE